MRGDGEIVEIAPHRVASRPLARIGSAAEAALIDRQSGDAALGPRMARRVERIGVIAHAMKADDHGLGTCRRPRPIRATAAVCRRAPPMRHLQNAGSHFGSYGRARGGATPSRSDSNKIAERRIRTGIRGEKPDHGRGKPARQGSRYHGAQRQGHDLGPPFRHQGAHPGNQNAHAAEIGEAAQRIDHDQAGAGIERAFGQARILG